MGTTDSDIAMNVERIREILPHRYPFALVDRVIEKKNASEGRGREGNSIVAIKNVSINEPFFMGHFPQRPIMPGVLIVEALAQAGGLAYYQESDSKLDFVIANVNKARFRKPVVPGDTLYLHASILKDRQNMILLSTQAKVNDEIVAEADIMAALMKN